MGSAIAILALLTAPTGALVEYEFRGYAEHARMEVVIARTAWTPARRAHAETMIGAWFESVARLGRPVPEQVDDVLHGHSLDLTRERYDLYVPDTRPDSGYGLLVYVPPSPVYRPPGQWRHVLAERGVILVVLRDAGNHDQFFLRRIPLALHAQANVAAMYPIDADRTYVGGFSGGARTAVSVALGFPDAFAGALAFGGSAPIGDTRHRLPEDEALSSLLISRTRVVVASGDHDARALRSDAATVSDLRDAGVTVKRMVLRNTGHAEPNGALFARAMHLMEDDR